jgi:hypothetical protein
VSLGDDDDDDHHHHHHHHHHPSASPSCARTATAVRISSWDLKAQIYIHSV